MGENLGHGTDTIMKHTQNFQYFFFIWMSMYTVYMIKYHFDKGILAQRNKYGSIYCLTRYLWCKRTEKHNF